MNSSNHKQESKNYKNSSRSITNDELLSQYSGLCSAGLNSSPYAENKKGGMNLFNFNMSNSSHSTNPNISKNSDLVKIKKLKIINLPLGAKNAQLNTNNLAIAVSNNNGVNSNFKQAKVLRKSYNSKKEIMPNIDSVTNGNKLTFEKAFSFRKSNASTPFAHNPNSINNIQNGNQFTNVFSQTNLHNTPQNSLHQNNQQSPIPINSNNPSQPQISISINNFNINNYNLNSKKFKKSSQISSSMTPNSLIEGKSLEIFKGSNTVTNSAYTANTANSANSANTVNVVTPKRNNKTNSFVFIKDDNTTLKEATKDTYKICTQNSENAILNSGCKLKIVKSEFNPTLNNAIKPLNKLSKKEENKIETIIDGNNDSFINELADLLNNVDEKPTKNREEPIRVSTKQIIKEVSQDFPSETNNEPNLDEENNQRVENNLEEVPDPRINFAQLQQVNSKRPQTSYGGLSARQNSLQKSLRQKSSKVTAISNVNKFEEFFPQAPDTNLNNLEVVNKNKVPKFKSIY